MNQTDMMKSYGLAPFPKDTVQTMAYVPFQENDPAVCSPHLGLENGTLFKTLNKPFYGTKCGVKYSD